jgi:hypothetical protein
MRPVDAPPRYQPPSVGLELEHRSEQNGHGLHQIDRPFVEQVAFVTFQRDDPHIASGAGHEDREHAVRASQFRKVAMSHRYLACRLVGIGDHHGAVLIEGLFHRVLDHRNAVRLFMEDS